MRRARGSVVERHPRNEGDVARDERQHAGREKAREPAPKAIAAEMLRFARSGRRQSASSISLRWYFALNIASSGASGDRTTDGAGW